MTIGELSRRGVTTSAIARKLDVTEGAVRYHLRRQEAGAVDGRSRQRFVADDWHEAIEFWLCQRGSRERLNLAALHRWLREGHGYSGDQVVPVAIVSREPRGLESENSAYGATADRLEQPGEATALHGLASRSTQVVIYDHHVAEAGV